MRSPDATVPGGQIQSISCSAANACTAVGSNLGTSGLNVTLAERWNGNAWHLQRAPNPAANTAPINSPDLTGVSCPAARFCEAVGSYQVGTVAISIAEAWNGRSWKMQAFPAPRGSTFALLSHVSCASARFCEAVGFYGNSLGDALAYAARWDGTSWRLQRMPNPILGAFFGEVTGVSCVSMTFCEAGEFVAGLRVFERFAVQWNGTSWRRQTVPGLTNVGAVSCASATFCEMLGSGGAAMWNGSSWSAQVIPSPAGATSSSLGGLSCATAAFCEAVGQFSDSSGGTFSLGATWNGTSWALQTTPNPAGVASTGLGAVSCTSVYACEAGGDFSLTTAATPIALAESWNGTSWRLQPVVTPPGAAANTLAGVSCVSASFCEAVGSRPDHFGLNTDALAEVWNGTRWTIQKAANPAKAVNGFRMSLSGVSCVSARFCEAVGSSSSAAGGGAEVWKGHSWALQVLPGGPLTSVSCTSTRFCTAAGRDGHVDVWNGTSWKARSSASGFISLTSVSCASPLFCEATGSGPNGDQAERWNGRRWSAQHTPAPKGGSSPALSAVSCLSPRTCEAVGSYSSNTTILQKTLAEVWNGTAWKVQRTPNAVTGFVDSNSLSAVWCFSASFCAAAGQYSPLTGNFTLAEVWNGRTWSLRNTPSPSDTGQDALNGVSCGTSHVCTAVGVTFDLGQIPATLIEMGH